MYQAYDHKNIPPHVFRKINKSDWECIKYINKAYKEKVGVLKEMDHEAQKAEAEIAKRLRNG